MSAPISVASSLGDHPGQAAGEPDLDTFLFNGTAGDEITLTLDADPRAGHNGGTAALGIRYWFESEATTGTLPLTLTTTLRTTGQYAVEVGQTEDRGRGHPFRGSYLLQIRPTTGSIDLIEPGADVEK